MTADSNYAQDRATVLGLFPLTGRFRPACTPLPERIAAVQARARRAVRDSNRTGAAVVFNQAALIASDVGDPAYARDLCRRHARLWMDRAPLDSESVVHALEPIVNLARLDIRQGNPDEARHRMRAVAEAVAGGRSIRVGAVQIPADLTQDPTASRAASAFLQQVLVRDGLRSLTVQGRWDEALAHVETYEGMDEQMQEGRQVAIIAALIRDDKLSSEKLLEETTPGQTWQQEAHRVLSILHHDRFNTHGRAVEILDEFMKVKLAQAEPIDRNEPDDPADLIGWPRAARAPDEDRNPLVPNVPMVYEVRLTLILLHLVSRVVNRWTNVSAREWGHASCCSTRGSA